MASCRRVPTADAAHQETYGTGEDYTSLSTWEAVHDVDLVTRTSGAILNVTTSGSSFDDSVTIAGATANATYFRLIRSESGSEPFGVKDAGPVFDSTANADVFAVNEAFVHFNDVEARHSMNSTSSRIVWDVGGNNVVLAACQIFGSTNSGSGSSSGITHAGDNGVIVNCGTFEIEDDGIRPDSGSGEEVQVLNCTSADNSQAGFEETGAGTHNPINCLAYNNTQRQFDSGWGASADYNAANGTSAPGTNAVDNISDPFADAANDDYFLDSGNTEVDDEGTDLSAHGFFDFDDDIKGNLRSSWSIGWHEIEAAAAGAQLVRHPIDRVRTLLTMAAFKGV